MLGCVPLGHYIQQQEMSGKVPAREPEVLIDLGSSAAKLCHGLDGT